MNPIPTRPLPVRKIQEPPLNRKPAFTCVTIPASFVLGCGILWFVVSIALAIGLGVPLALAQADKGGWDLSGFATCYNNSIVFQPNMTIWKTYPLAPYAENISYIPPSFTGKNLFALASAESGFGFLTAKIQRIDNHTVYFDESVYFDASKALFANQICFVTIDSLDTFNSKLDYFASPPPPVKAVSGCG